ncbi:MAG TPA: DUF4097 family beta strand repeat protein [Clostridiaceae bacterium]|nr:DUF4097 family beta strand repeat protein [Clostridiaceae bacterium]
MNRTQYLMALYDALKDIPSQERTDVISEYREYFRIEMENGRTEEEICSSLGDPVTLAYAIKQRRGYGPDSQETFYKKPHRKNGIFKTIATVISAIVVLCIVFGGTIMFSFSKGKGLIFGAAKKYEINDVRTITPDSAKTIIIKTASTDTSILPSDSEIIKGSLVGNVRATSPDHVPTLKITRSGDTIIIEEKREVFGVIGFYWEDVKLDISIPESFKGAVEFEGTSGDLKASDLDIGNFLLKVSSGNVRLDNITVENNMKLTSGSGDFMVKELKATKLILQSTAGNKEFRDVYIKENFNINSTSGDTVLNSIKCHELGIDSTSGNINIDKLQLDRISIETKSGDVNVRDLEGNAQIDASSGNINVSVKEADEEIYIKAISGDIELRMPADKSFTLDSRTSSGNINCDFKLEDKVSDDNTLKGIYLNGDILLNIKTSSGNIDIERQ